MARRELTDGIAGHREEPGRQGGAAAAGTVKAPADGAAAQMSALPAPGAPVPAAGAAPAEAASQDAAATSANAPAEAPVPANLPDAIAQPVASDADWWRGAIIYQIYPRSFQDDGGPDGAPDGVGDLKGITRRLPHIASLGVDAIWLSPIFPSPMADMGYDVSDYTGIDPVFGTIEDFDALVAAAHALGLKVIIDQVLNHTSDRHPWFTESRAFRPGQSEPPGPHEADEGGAYTGGTDPAREAEALRELPAGVSAAAARERADWYVWADPKPDGSVPNNWQSHFGGPAWEWDQGRRQYYMHNYLAAQPDLNIRNPAVQDALLGVLRFWLERGVDGFRLDAVNYYFCDAALPDNPPAPLPEDGRPPPDTYDMQLHLHDKTQAENLAFLARIRALTDQYGARTLIGECGEAPARAVEIMAEYTTGHRLHMAYSFAMLGFEFTPEHFRDCIEGFFAAGPDGWPSWSFSNHDVNRHVSRWASQGHGAPGALARQAIALLASFRGSIGIYQGEELGQTETELARHELTDPPGIRFWPEHKGRDGCRTPMTWEAEAPHAGFSPVRPWLPVKPEQAGRAVDLQEADPTSMLHHYRAVLAFRRQNPALISGGGRFLDLEAPLLGFLRGEDEAGTLACLFNLSPKARQLDLTEAGLDGHWSPTGPGASAHLIGGTVSFEANGWIWLRPD